MREIKFRVWADGGMCHSDAREDDYIPEDAIYWNIEHNGISIKILELIDRLVNGEHEQTEEYIKYNNLPIMQYTGLKDKNNKEIYHHDIVKNEFGDLFLIHMFDYAMLSLLMEMELEIVGNMYETPKLLKDIL